VTTDALRVRRVEAALREEIGKRAAHVLHKKTRHLADLTPHEVAQAPSGDRIVLAVLNKIVLEASML
jgi:hypothetical protein